MVIKLPDNLQEAIKTVSRTLDSRMAQLLRVPETDSNTVISLSAKKSGSGAG